MAWSAVRSLVWKDYRALRGLWCAIAVGTIALQGLVLWWHWGSTLTLDAAYRVVSAGILMTAIYGVAAAGILFAGEREEGTADFLARLPWSGIRVAGVKIGLAVVTVAVLLCVVLLTGAIWILSSRLSNGMRVYEDYGLWVVSLLILIFFMWGVGTSLLMRHVLWSVLLAGLGGLLTTFSPPYLPFGLGLEFLLVLLVVVDGVLAWRWNREGFWLGWLRSQIARGRQIQNPVAVFLASERPTVERVSEAKRAWERLVWMEWRNVQWFAMFALPVLVAVGVMGLSSGEAFKIPGVTFENSAGVERRGLKLDEMSQGAGVLLPFVLACFAGVLCWWGEIRQKQYLFQAERGFSPRLLLWSKNRVWLMVVGLIALDFFLFTYLLMSRFPTATMVYNGEAAGLCLLLASWIVVLFLWSELVALLIPSAVLGMCGALMGGGLLLVWGYRMWTLGLPMWAGVLPCLGVLWVALQVRVRDWMLSRPGWRPYGKVVGVLALGWVGITAMGACYRAWEFPKVEFPPPYVTSAPRWESLERGSDEERLLARRFAVEITRVSENDFWVESEKRLFTPEARKEIQSLVGRVPEEGRLGEILPNQNAISRLATTYLIKAKAEMKEGKLDEAFEHLCDVVRIYRLSNRGLVAPPEMDQILGRSLEQVRLWSAAAGQTSARVTAGIRKLEVEFRKFPKLYERFVYEEALAERRWEEEFRTRGWVEFWTRYRPWELERGRRIVRLEYAASYLRACVFEAQERGDLPNLVTLSESEHAYLREVRQVAEEIRSGRGNRLDPYFARVHDCMRYREGRGYSSVLTMMRGTLLVMGVCAYRLEEGRLPERLADLLGRSFGELPRDPVSGVEFRYEPRGLANAVTLSRAVTLPAKTPFLYRGAGFDATPIGAPHRDMVMTYKRAMDREGRSTDAEDVFEIPVVEGK